MIIEKILPDKVKMQLFYLFLFDENWSIILHYFSPFAWLRYKSELDFINGQLTTSQTAVNTEYILNTHLLIRNILYQH